MTLLSFSERFMLPYQLLVLNKYLFSVEIFSLQKNINSRWEKWSNLSVVKSKALKCPYNFFLAFLMLILTSYWSGTTRNQLKSGRYSLWKRGDFQDLNASTEYASVFKDNWRQYDRKLSVFLLLLTLQHDFVC